MEKIKVGVIGTGGIGEYAHIKELKKCGSAEVLAVCDIDEARVKEIAERYSIPYRYTDYRDLLSRDDIDAVVISTPNISHYEIGIEAIKAKKHILCEKPLAMNVKEAKEMYEKAEETGIKHMVAFSYRFCPSAKFAKSLIDSNYIGKIFHISAEYNQSWLVDPNTPLVWRLIKAQSGSGVLGDLGSHIIDLIRWMTGLEFESVLGDLQTFVKRRKKLDSEEYGDVDVDDYSAFLAYLDNETRASVITSRYATGYKNYQRIEIYGDKGSLIYEFDRPYELSVCLGEPLVKLREFVTIPVPESYQSIHGSEEQAKTFIESILYNRPCPTFYDGLKAQEVIDAVILSIERGCWIKI